MPEGAKCQKARNAETDAKGSKCDAEPLPTADLGDAVWRSGRRLASGAVWHLAPFGIWRCSAFRRPSTFAV